MESQFRQKMNLKLKIVLKISLVETQREQSKVNRTYIHLAEI